MDKLFDRLNEMHRALVLVAATTLLFVIGANRPTVPIRGTIDWLGDEIEAHRKLQYEVARAAKHFYARQIADGVKAASLSSTGLSISRAMFMPAMIDVEPLVQDAKQNIQQCPLFRFNFVIAPGKPIQTRIPLDTNRLSAAELRCLSWTGVRAASYPLLELKPAKLADALRQAALDDRTTYRSTDLRVVVVPPSGEEPRCTLIFRSATASARGESDPYWLVPCGPEGPRPQDATELVKQLSPRYSAPQPLPDRLSDLDFQPLAREKAVLEAIAAKYDADAADKTDLLGVAIPTDAVWIVGPGLLFVILLSLLAYTTLLPRPMAKMEVADQWLGLFRGWRVALPVLTIVLLPVVASLAAVARVAGDERRALAIPAVNAILAILVIANNIVRKRPDREASELLQV